MLLVPSVRVAWDGVAVASVLDATRAKAVPGELVVVGVRSGGYGSTSTERVSKVSDSSPAAGAAAELPSSSASSGTSDDVAS